MDINTELEMCETEFERTMDTWTEIEDIIIRANKQAMLHMENDNDDDLLVKFYAVSVFISRIQYIFHENLKKINTRIEKLKTKIDEQGTRIPIEK